MFPNLLWHDIEQENETLGKIQAPKEKVVLPARELTHAKLHVPTKLLLHFLLSTRNTCAITSNNIFFQCLKWLLLSKHYSFVLTNTVMQSTYKFISLFSLCNLITVCDNQVAQMCSGMQHAVCYGNDDTSSQRPVINTAIQPTANLGLVVSSLHKHTLVSKTNTHLAFPLTLITAAMERAIHRAVSAIHLETHVHQCQYLQSITITRAENNWEQHSFRGQCNRGWPKYNSTRPWKPSIIIPL